MQDNNIPHIIDLIVVDNDDNKDIINQLQPNNPPPLETNNIFNRAIPSFDPAVYSFLQGDLLTYEGGRKVHFFIRGRPVVQEQTRHYGSAVVNPLATRMEQFKSATRDMLDTAGAPAGIPMFGAKDYIAASIIFHMPRPLSDFLGRNQLTGARTSSGPFTHVLGDLDNHLKLVLDAMNDTIYPDDCQVVIICALKIADNVGMSNGSTEVIMRKIRARDIHLALSSMRM